MATTRKCRECPKWVEPGKRLCRTCADRHAARQKVRYHARRAAGVCGVEGCDRKPEAGAYCAACKLVMNVRTRLAKRKARGV